MHTSAVTGTNGKTSTVEFARQLFARTGVRAVSVSSIGDTGEAGTRPTPFFLSRRGCWSEYIQELGLEHDAAVLEAFSAGLAAGEWDGAPLDCAVLTTFGHDHLDIHGSLAAYARAKLHLFDRVLPRGGTAVVRTTCELAPEVAAIGRGRHQEVITYGQGGDVVVRRTDPCPHGVAAEIEAFGHVQEVVVPVGASFLVDNALAALCVTVAAGIDVAEAFQGLTELRVPPGRMHHVPSDSGGDVFVDLAHTPDSLEAVLGAARQRARGHVVLVFGCGGQRDPSKRSLMGEVASRLADAVIVTDDNPRRESAAEIRAAILEGCPDAIEVPDRVSAIERGMALLGPDDVLVLCGRGTEKVQDLGAWKRACDDLAIVQALQEGPPP